MIEKTLVVEKLIVLCEQLHKLFVFGKVYMNEVSIHYSHPPSYIVLILNFIVFHTCTTNVVHDVLNIVNIIKE